jgi:hypothetical protein
MLKSCGPAFPIFQQLATRINKLPLNGSRGKITSQKTIFKRSDNVTLINEPIRADYGFGEFSKHKNDRLFFD